MISAMNYHRASFYNLHGQNISIILPFAEAEFLLNQLTYLIREASCSSLAIRPSFPEVLALASNFLEGKTVSTLSFDVSQSSSTFLIHLIDLFNVTSLRLNLFTSVSDSYLINLGGTVDSMSISDRNCCSPCFSMRNSREVLHLTIEIFSEKCSRLDIADTYVDFSFTDASWLYLRLRTKKIHFTARTTMGPLSFPPIGIVKEGKNVWDMNRLTVKN
ncbi:hypothetical protein PMAYCL1PPCAC_31350 [Pristionchus mayeri]|uniref:Uncharacterized protein n=1 Tax=Pristionchus mayeri TaxID=1317129 RepID=A0AAN5IEJ8_9BILA|nr:hypothetical protein PMAYCL1PPCAC_31350 [Pristionchus mayeri]